MAFEEVKDNVEDLKHQAKEVFEANIRYYKLWGFKIVAKSTSAILKMFLLGTMLLIVTIFLSIAVALGIGYALDNFAYGFLIVGLMYLICAIVVYYVQDRIVEKPLLRILSGIFLKNYDDEDAD